ncbi:sensor histidine kinase [Nonomuraea zeae]|uniref:histidine kinase n=1 Tax=Nonomuraea zeae TaxID=1642303 RepID=A0A5S4F0M9_9ACTN|nr:sensor histidine kinase [Nonomuraea zeae]TMR09608.1 hypothetical protein ETD85_61280 [Nonomuraea zeae]
MIRRITRMVAEPGALALFRGDADPPPSARRLTFPVPGWLGVLPARTVSLVQLADLVLAFVLFGLTLSMVLGWNLQAAIARESPSPVSDLFLYLAAFGVSLPVALRDRWPLAAWRVAAVLLPVVLWVTATLDGSQPPYAAPMVLMYLLVLYSVAVRCDRRITLGVWFVTVLAGWIIHPNSMALVTIIVSVAVLFGYNVRVRRTATARLVAEERRSKVAESAQAVLEERTRIARELHDVVAHHMSVIAIQAEAVPLRAAGDPAVLEAGLAEIRGLSLEAIAELRQVLGVLRDEEGRTDTAPQPGLDRVDELISNARAAGLAVVVKRSGPLEQVPSTVGLSAYRIVQESLSNAMRHAPGATVAVELTAGGTAGLPAAGGAGSPPRAGASDLRTAGGAGSPPTSGAANLRTDGGAGSPPTAGPANLRTDGGAGGLPAADAAGLPTADAAGLPTAGGAGGLPPAGGRISGGLSAAKDAASPPAVGAGGLPTGSARGLPTDGAGVLGQGPQELRLRIANGPGTGPGAAKGAGQGLVGMRERAALLGGTIETGPQPGGGFEVRVTLPLQERAAL